MKYKIGVALQAVARNLGISAQVKNLHYRFTNMLRKKKRLKAQKGFGMTKRKNTYGKTDKKENVINILGNMAHYIDKDSVVAEIEKLRDEAKIHSSDFSCGRLSICKELMNFLDTLEVKEVDLEKEIQQHINDCLDIKFPTTDIKMIAKDVEYTARKFFELGLKAKGE